MSENVTTEPGGASPNVLAALTNSDLDQKIGAKIQMIGNALKGRDRAIAEIEKCEKSAVQSAWRLGQFLIEKKKRLVHGEWGAFLYALPHVSPTSATNYMRLARGIGSAADLKSSIRETLELLPAPATAKPKSKPTLAVRIVEPATAKPKTIAVKIVEPEPVWPTSLDSAAMIEGLEKELYREREKVADLEERNAIIVESADPEAQKTADTINNQRALIQTLKAGVAEWQGKASAARKEITTLKRRIKGLENPAGGGR